MKIWNKIRHLQRISANWINGRRCKLYYISVEGYLELKNLRIFCHRREIFGYNILFSPWLSANKNHFDNKLFRKCEKVILKPLKM